TTRCRTSPTASISPWRSSPKTGSPTPANGAFNVKAVAAPSTRTRTAVRSVAAPSPERTRTRKSEQPAASDHHRFDGVELDERERVVRAVDHRRHQKRVGPFVDPPENQPEQKRRDDVAPDAGKPRRSDRRGRVGESEQRARKDDRWNRREHPSEDALHATTEQDFLAGSRGEKREDDEIERERRVLVDGAYDLIRTGRKADVPQQGGDDPRDDDQRDDPENDPAERAKPLTNRRRPANIEEVGQARIAHISEDDAD